MIKDKFVMPISIFEEEGFSEITVPEIVETKKDAGIVIRGASIQLIALLESGDLDYAFEYESVIRQHDLKWIDLPDSINLGTPDQDPVYGQVQVKLDFRRFASVEPVFKGEQIGYGITIPSSSPEPKIAEDFVSFLLGPQGREIMNTNYHPLLDSITCDQIANVPQNLTAFCAKEQ
jgi:molybdate/tungstate transport system substrate-binding protein